MPAKFAMVITPASIPPAPQRENGETAGAEMAARVASGPGFWTEWLAELDRQGLLEDLLAEGVIARALREAPSGHKYDRVLTAKMTVVCVLVACLFPGAGYDRVLATAFGLPGLRPLPGADPDRPGIVAGQEAARRAGHEEGLRAGRRRRGRGPRDRAAVEGPGGHRDRRHHDGAGQERRAGRRVRHPRGRRPAAAAGHRPRPHRDLPLDRRRDRRLPRRRERPGRPAGRQFRPGMLNLADRGFFSMHRWIRFSGTGAHLAWRVKNGAKSVPLKTIRTLPDGSELVMLHESDGMRTRRRKETGDPRAERLPDTPARLVTFTITAATRSGRMKTTRMRVLTTLLDHEAYPARDIAVLYAERWQIEIAFLHLKRTVRGPRRPLRGQSPELARQEAWALLLIHNITATAAARAAGPAGIDPGLIPFTAVLGLIRSHVAADACCRHCGHRPASPLASLNAAILALPGTGPDASGHPAELQPNDEPGTPKKSPTPSRSQSRISRNGTQLRKLKGSGVCPG